MGCISSSSHQLEDGHSLYDYGVGLNDNIQLLVRHNVSTPSKDDKWRAEGSEYKMKVNVL